MGLWFANGGFEMFLPSFYRLLPSFFFFFFLLLSESLSLVSGATIWGNGRSEMTLIASFSFL